MWIVDSTWQIQVWLFQTSGIKKNIFNPLLVESPAGWICAQMGGWQLYYISELLSVIKYTTNILQHNGSGNDYVKHKIHDYLSIHYISKSFLFSVWSFKGPYSYPTHFRRQTLPWYQNPSKTLNFKIHTHTNTLHEHGENILKKISKLKPTICKKDNRSQLSRS